MKKVRIALCIFKTWHFFTSERFEVFRNWRDTKSRTVKGTAQKRQNRAGATPLFFGQAAQKFPGVAPALDDQHVGLFCAVESQNKQSFMHALLNFACRKGETAWQF